MEPAECAILARRQWGPHGIEGIGDGFIPENLDVSLLTGVITGTTQESVAMAQRLAREEGIFCVTHALDESLEGSRGQCPGESAPSRRLFP